MLRGLSASGRYGCERGVQTMAFRSISTRLSLYGLVGIVAAAVHYGVLIGLRWVMPTWLANPLAFLAASLTGYLGHARFTFRPETGGARFARRWLVMQYAINLSVCGLLPLALPAATLATLIGTNASIAVLDTIFVFTPTVLNALIWSRAARFSQRRRSHSQRPRLHADDLGLSQATNAAILGLIEAGQLDGASLLVNGPETRPALERWHQLATLNPNQQLCLHLCLTEGPSSAPCDVVPDLVNSHGHFHLSFGQWLLLSLLPRRHRRRRLVTTQLRLEISAQIQRFRQLCGSDAIALDGHQHIHLVPLIHDTLLSLAAEQRITWMRSTAEPLPTGLPLRCWWEALRGAGLIKWSVLQLLSAKASKRQRRHGIASNSGFAGVLFTGQMSGAALQACWLELCSRKLPDDRLQTPAQLLVHPGGPLECDLEESGFAVSAPFASSPWRQREWRAIQQLMQTTGTAN